MNFLVGGSFLSILVSGDVIPFLKSADGFFFFFGAVAIPLLSLTPPTIAQKRDCMWVGTFFL